MENRNREIEELIEKLHDLCEEHSVPVLVAYDNRETGCLCFDSVLAPCFEPLDFVAQACRRFIIDAQRDLMERLVPNEVASPFYYGQVIAEYLATQSDCEVYIRESGEWVAVEKLQISIADSGNVAINLGFGYILSVRPDFVFYIRTRRENVGTEKET